MMSDFIKAVKRGWSCGALQASIGISLCLVFGLGFVVKYGVLIDTLPLWGYVGLIGFGLLLIMHANKKKEESRRKR